MLSKLSTGKSIEPKKVAHSKPECVTFFGLNGRDQPFAASFINLKMASQVALISTLLTNVSSTSVRSYMS